MSTTSAKPVVADQALIAIQQALSDHFALFDSRPANDKLEHTVVFW
jgi:hypothetical protein